ncbi:transcriptional regulator [Klebsiella pneumoniae]|nr:transcriptional regulator [Klebsiella pneumoniae]
MPGSWRKELLKPLRETAEAISRELGFTVREASGK